MARRNVRGGAPAHIGHSGASSADDESAFRAFKREQWDNPEKRAGNISIVTSLTLFLGSIVAFRIAGEAIAPA